MKNIFVIAYADYEEYSPYYLTGPEEVTQSQFKTLCDSLLEEAGFDAIKTFIGTYIGWREIVESVIPLLKNHGFDVFNPKIVEYSGPGIIDGEYEARGLGEAKVGVVAHNVKIREADY